MRSRLLIVAVSAFIGFGMGYWRGRIDTDRDWAKRTVPGIAVDCYGADGKLIEESGFWSQFPKTSCAPGQIAKVHQAK